MTDILIDLQNFNSCKIQLRTAINFISSKDLKEGRVKHPKSKNTEFMSSGNLNNVVDEFFEFIILKYQGHLETLRRGINYIFDLVQLLN